MAVEPPVKTMDGNGKMFGLTLAALLLVGGLAAMPAGAEEPVTPVSEEHGETTLLGGGDHHFLRFGHDAAFGVLWGTEEHPNHVYLVAIKARYLGVADVRGDVQDEDRPLKIYTVYAVKLESLFEFDDLDGNGIALYQRVHDGENYTTYVQTEPLYKRVSLNAAWTDSPVVKEEPEPGVTTWGFSLTATNLPYLAMAGSNATGTLDEVTFTFHLRTAVVHVDNRTVQEYEVHVSRVFRQYRIDSFTHTGTVNWSGDLLRYQVKWDQRIVGWDYDPLNANPGVVLEMHALVANRIPTERPEWFDAAIVARLNEGGHVRFRDASGERSANETEGVYPAPRPLRSPWLQAGGDWTFIGDLTWVSNATVDGNPAQVYAQIQAVTRARIVADNAVYVGLGALIGMSFPGGSDIDHDPTFAADAFELSSTTQPPKVGGLLLVLVAVAVAAVVALVATKGRKKPAPVRQAYQQPAKAEDWSRYYER